MKVGSLEFTHLGHGLYLLASGPVLYLTQKGDEWAVDRSDEEGCLAYGHSTPEAALATAAGVLRGRAKQLVEVADSIEKGLAGN